MFCRKDPFYFTLYEALRDHGAIPPPYVVSWYDLPAIERNRSLMVNLAHASIWNGVEAERYAQDQAAAGRHDVTISEYDMFGNLICERPPPDPDHRLTLGALEAPFFCPAFMPGAFWALLGPFTFHLALPLPVHQKRLQSAHSAPGGML